MALRSTQNKIIDGHKAHRTKIYQWGEQEPKRAADAHVWTKTNGKDSTRNPFSRQNFYPIKEIERARHFEKWRRAHPDRDHSENPYRAAIAKQIPQFDPSQIYVEFLLNHSHAERVRDDIAVIQADPTISATQRAALVQARLGQGQYRAALMRRWGYACAVTGWPIPQLLRASHIKRWSESNDTERLDPSNGLLLGAHLDALFDCGLISFLDDGRMLVSKAIDQNYRRAIGIPRPLRIGLDPQERGYLAWHRKHMFEPAA